MKIFGYDFKSAKNKIDTINSLSKEEFLLWQEEQKWKIIFFHNKNNLLYQSKLASKIPNEWSKIPIMEKKDFQSDLKKMISKGIKKNDLFIGSTSGSTGTPFFYAKNKFSHSMTWALTLNRYNFHDIKLRSLEARFYGRSNKIEDKIKEKIKDIILNRFLFSVFDLSNQACQNYLNYFKKIKFKYIYGYTNSLIIFSKFLIKEGLTLKKICSSVRVCIVTSEMLLPEDRLLLSNSFGIPIINEYGVSEAGGIIAFEDNQFNWVLSKETQFIEIVDENNKILPIGSEGEILITDLFNKAMPFIRYKTGDIGRLKEKKGTLYLDKLIGRKNDNIILPNGKISPGLTFYYISKALLEKTGIINEFIIRQVKIDTFIFEMVMSRNFERSEIKYLEKSVSKYLQSNLKIVLKKVPEIKRPDSGKIKHFFSELK